MTEAYSAHVGGANPAPSISGPTVPQSGAIIDAFRQIFPAHGRKVLARLLGLSDGAARKKLSGERELSIDELACLLRTESGFEILTAIMANARPKWWRLCAPLMEAADARKLQHAAQKKIQKAIRGALDADTDLAAAISRSEAALSVQDADFHQPYLDAVRATSRIPNSALAQASAKGKRR